MVNLNDLYKQIPKFKCIEGCNDCCGPIPCNNEEAERIGKKPEAHFDGVAPLCEFSTKNGCSIYENRPMACRIYGTVQEPDFLCPHGCAPLFMLGEEQANDIQSEYLETLNLKGQGDKDDQSNL